MSEVLPSMEELLDRAYQQGRADVIEEFADKLKEYIHQKTLSNKIPYWHVAIDDVAEQLKEQSNEV